MVKKNIPKNITLNLGTTKKKRGRPRKKQEPKEVIIKEILPSQKFSRKQNKALDQLMEANRDKEKAQLEKSLIELVRMRGTGDDEDEFEEGFDFRTGKKTKERKPLERQPLKALPQFGSTTLKIPPFFAVPTAKGWRLANPLTEIRNLANRQHKLSINIKRSNVKKPEIDMSIPRSIPTLEQFSLKDQEKLRAYMKAVEDGTEDDYLFKNKPRGFPAVLYKNAKKGGYKETTEKIYRKNTLKPKKVSKVPVGRPSKITGEGLSGFHCHSVMSDSDSEDEEDGGCDGEGSGGSLSVKDLKGLLGASFDPRQDTINNFDLDKEISSPTSKVYVNKITGQVVVAHMGTKGIIDWGNNAVYAYGGDWAYKQTNRFKEAKKVQDKAEKKYGADKVSTIGYSQGGLQAEMLGKKSKEIITYNKATRPLSNSRSKNQYDIRTSGDIVSGLNPFQTKNKKEIEIKSKTYNPITEHSRKALDRIDEEEIIGNGLEEYEELLSRYNNIMPSQGGRMLGLTRHAVLPAHAGHPALMSDQYPRIPQSFTQIHLRHPVPIGGRGMCGGMIHDDLPNQYVEEGVAYNNLDLPDDITPRDFMKDKIIEIVDKKIAKGELTPAMGKKIKQKAIALSHFTAGRPIRNPTEAVRKALQMEGGRMEGGRTYAQRLAARTRRTFAPVQRAVQNIIAPVEDFARKTIAPVENFATKTFTPQLGRDITSGLIHKALPAVISGIAGSAATLATGNPYVGFAVGQTAGKYAGKKAGDELGKATGYGLGGMLGTPPRITPLSMVDFNRINNFLTNNNNNDIDPNQRYIMFINILDSIGGGNIRERFQRRLEGSSHSNLVAGRMNIFDTIMANMIPEEEEGFQGAGMKRPKLVKGSKEAKEYMASIRSKKMKGGNMPPRSRGIVTEPSLL